MPRKRGLISGASFGARLGGMVKFDDVIDFLRLLKMDLEILQPLSRFTVMVWTWITLHSVQMVLDSIFLKMMVT